jgi:hypothetical protein
MLRSISTYLHFGNNTGFHTKKEFTKIGKKWNIQNKHNKWMEAHCTFSYRQIFDAETGEMQEPIMFFSDLNYVSAGNTFDDFNDWFGGNYNYEVYEVKEDHSDVIDEGTYVVVTPTPENIKLGKAMDLHGTFECPVYVFKDWEFQFIFNIYGVAICAFTDGSQLMLLGQYSRSLETKEIYTSWSHCDINVSKQKDYLTEAEEMNDSLDDWSMILGNLLVPPSAVIEENKVEIEID